MRRLRNFDLPWWLSAGPALAFLLFFMVVPVAAVAAYSLMVADPYGGVEPAVSTGAYVQFLFNRDWDDNLVF